jgi:cobyrinic acid a,c-diamide synthase
VARDRAFNFYYADNLAALERAGAECIPFSPLTDSVPPPDLDGLYLGGGFPEMFAAALADNVGMKKALAEQLAAGLPAIAECGGLMYLGRSLTDFDGQTWPMVGALPLDTAMTGRLSLGYRRVTALQASPLLSAGATLWGHEFHRSALTSSVAQPLYETEPYPVEGAVLPQASQEGICQGNIHASYVHLHWGDRPELPTASSPTAANFSNSDQPTKHYYSNILSHLEYCFLTTAQTALTNFPLCLHRKIEMENQSKLVCR